MQKMVDPRKFQNELSAKNRKVAILLGLVAASIYAGYILAYYF